MSKIELQLYRGASVLMTVDGEEALGILNFSAEGAAGITTLCFVTSGAECPIIQHHLTEEDIATMSSEGRNRLVSRLSLTSVPAA